ncbi:hypothetical protein [Sphaerotilus sp.]|uniref:hypothetical protein n=1 Tax=Sphaerotilus sp. TaxID=2093942 RepID=UPI00286E789F|nr:hypothetical protein [Sphaerotilus sp.]
MKRCRPEPLVQQGHQRQQIDRQCAVPVVGQHVFEQHLARHGLLPIVEASVPCPEIPVRQFWHRRAHRDAGNLCGCAG